MLLWLALLMSYYVPAVPAIPQTIAGMATHAFLMLYGVFTFFVFGFLSTVFPRWLAAPTVGRGRYAAIAAFMMLGMIGYYAGLFTSQRVALIGSLLFVVGWGLGVTILLGIWRQSARPDKRFALAPLGCVTAGGVGALLYGIWLWTQWPALLALSIAVGTWLYLVPLIVVVSYRMIPFFSARVLSDYRVVKPGWTLPATLLCVVYHCGLVAVHRP
jgi:uncharacterized protein involved in response to NO